MTIEPNLLATLIGYGPSPVLEFSLFLQDRPYQLVDVSVTRSPTPVTRPTTRGGVYFSEKFAYRITGTIKDTGIVPLLSKAMLGPNTEFGDIQIRTKLLHAGKMVQLNLHAHLTSSVEGPLGIELHMILVGLESV